MSNIFKDFDLVKGTGMKASIAGAGAILNGYQAVRARVDYGNKMIEIKNYDDNRQEIKNPFGQLENPYKNLAVATQAAEIKMEQTDQALANTLDTLRETGAAAGGATAIANAALKSKQGVAASIETQEINNQKLQAQGQLQVDIAKGKGEMERFDNQEARDTNELNRLQSQSDMAQYRRDTSIQSGLEVLGDAAGVRNAGIVPEQKDQKDKGVPSAADTNTGTMGPVNYDYGQSSTKKDPNTSALGDYGNFQASDFKGTGKGTKWDDAGLNSMIAKRNTFDPESDEYTYISNLITDTKQPFINNQNLAEN